MQPLHQRLPGDTARRARIEASIRDQYDRLTRYEAAEGGWGYYDFDAGTQRPASSSISFVNSAVLIATYRGLHESQQALLEHKPVLNILDRKSNV